MSLKELRIKKGFSLASVAEHLSVSRSTVCLWESGERKCSVDSLVELSKLYRVSMATITAAYMKTHEGENNG